MSTFSLPLNFQTQQTAPQNPIDPFARPAAPVEQTTTQSSVSESTAESASQKNKFCSNCGTPANGNFCSNCGTKIG